MYSYASNNYKRCSATPQTSVRVIGLQHLHTAEHMHTAEARAMRRWESALHAAQSMTYIRPRPTRTVSYPNSRKFPFPNSSGTAQRRTRRRRRCLGACSACLDHVSVSPTGSYVSSHSPIQFPGRGRAAGGAAAGRCSACVGAENALAE